MVRNDRSALAAVFPPPRFQCPWCLLIVKERNQSGVRDLRFVHIKSIIQPLQKYTIVSWKSRLSQKSVANRAGTRCMWVVSVQDMRVGCCAPPMCPEQSDGEGTMHMFQMTEKKLSTCHTHSLTLLFHTSRSCRLTRVRGW